MPLGGLRNALLVGRWSPDEYLAETVASLGSPGAWEVRPDQQRFCGLFQDVLHNEIREKIEELFHSWIVEQRWMGSNYHSNPPSERGNATYGFP
jgi:hypothetical protein